MPTTYKLSYFDIRGRAEMTRMAFAAADVKFEDCRVQFEDWPTMKPSTPQGAMPLLEVDGKVLLYQSFAIARYVAREFHLYGKNNLEAAQIDIILDTILDLNNRGLAPGGPWFRETDQAKQAEKKAEFMAEDAAPKFLGFIEKAIEKFGSSGFAVSKSLSIADIALYAVLEYWRMKDSLEDYPKIAAVLKKVEEDKNIAKYLKERPERPF